MIFSNYQWMVEKINKLYPNAMFLMRCFEDAGYEIRVVGGCIRNLALNYPVKDIDFVVNCLPEKIKDILHLNNIKSIDIGISFGTVAAKFQDEIFEITTTRKDVKCFGRKAEVEFGVDFAADAARRDFTFNALSLSSAGVLYDYFGGLSDIENKRIRFIGDPCQRIREDNLRILRFYRFLGSYAEVFDEQSRAACISSSNLLNCISGERIESEMKEILLSDNAYNIMKNMQNDNLMIYILGTANIDLSLLLRMKEMEKKYQLPSKMIRYIALYVSGESYEYLSKRWVRSKLNQKYLQNIMMKPNICLANVAQIIYLYGREMTYEFVLHQNVVSGKEFFDISNIDVVVVPDVFIIHSSDLINLGYNGKLLGEKLRYLEDIWINSNFTITKSDLLLRLKE